MPAWSLTRCYRIGAALAAAGGLAPGILSADARLVVESGPGSAAGVSWSEFRLIYQPVGDLPPNWQLHIDDLVLDASEAALGRVELACADGRLVLGWPECASGKVRWQPVDGEILEGNFRSDRRRDGYPALEIQLADPAAHVLLVLAEDDFTVHLTVNDLPLARVAGPLSELLSLSDLDGRVTATATFHSAGAGELKATGQIAGVAFDTPDGRFAAGDVALTFDASLSGDGEGWRFDTDVTQSAGEWLFGPMYIPAPEQPVHLRAGGRLTDTLLELDRLELEESGVLSLTGGLVLQRRMIAPDSDDENAATEPVWAINALDIRALEAHLPAAQDRYLEGVLIDFALDDLDSQGTIEARARIDAEGLEFLDLALVGVYAEDDRGRFGVFDLNGELHWRRADHHLETVLAWAAVSIHDIPLGSSGLHLKSETGRLYLDRPLVVPLFDGALSIEHMEWLDWGDDSARLNLDARLEPVDFSLLSVSLGWPELGGRVSGRFPGVTYADQVLSFEGGIEIEAFSGRIGIRELAVERPFGTLPGLSAEVEMERLDLLEVTGALGFGRMEGRLGGYIRGLRMLNWQPVALDARLATVRMPGVRQRISQRAVDDISSLGGGSGALTAPLLSLFDDFSYRRVGLSCRLTNNVCLMGGVADRDDGGFVIVEGRGLPRLNIIGYRRLVDWPLLVQQLQTATEAEVR